ncbi:protein TolR [Rhodoferax koreense]|uniref:Protein TolR n=1 Tax=Rhodoferax koreensis TaxID=1842727 RepID=A0A1P8JZ63_9BURK|nr:protein TolR [Rhodoferax koreense]APW39044.1 protein TolR [Rhodoferax koreense]
MPSMVSRGRGRRTINEINMVPFIDVMLVLLIIFMVTAPLVTPSLIDLPSVGKAGKTPDKVIQIVIAKDETLELKDQGTTTRLTTRDVASAVKKAQGDNTNTPVVISADRNVKYESVVKVMDTLQRSGVQRVGLSVQLGGK